MAKKKKTRSPARGSSQKRKASGNGKFHGAIKVIPPKEGKVLEDGTNILVAIREVQFGNLPDIRKNEVSLVTTVDTHKQDETIEPGMLKVELLRYVPDNHALNIRDLVIYSGPVHRHLTITSAITELDESAIESMKEVVAASLKLAADLAGGGTAASVLGGVAPLVGAILSLNKDDQVLSLHHSFYTASVSAPGQPGRGLREGEYCFQKVRVGEREEKPQVALKLEVMKVAA